jgi:hypothetical protein
MAIENYIPKKLQKMKEDWNRTDPYTFIGREIIKKGASVVLFTGLVAVTTYAAVSFLTPVNQVELYDLNRDGIEDYLFETPDGKVLTLQSVEQNDTIRYIPSLSGN